MTATGGGGSIAGLAEPPSYCYGRLQPLSRHNNRPSGAATAAAASCNKSSRAAACCQNPWGTTTPCCSSKSCCCSRSRSSSSWCPHQIAHLQHVVLQSAAAQLAVMALQNCGASFNCQRATVGTARHTQQVWQCSPAGRMSSHKQQLPRSTRCSWGQPCPVHRSQGLSVGPEWHT